MIERIQRTLDALKVFPLPNVVLLPGGLLPLHIFEPRYRALVRDALASDSVMAMALLEPGWEPNYAGNPVTRPIACAAVIEQHQALPDGRFNILLRGICRVRLLREGAGRYGYRELEAKIVVDEPSPGVDDSALRSALLELAMRIPPESAQPLLQLTSRSHGGALADSIASAVISDPDVLGEVLEELSVPKRLERVSDHVVALLENLPPGQPGLLN